MSMTNWQRVGGLAFVIGALMAVFSIVRPESFEFVSIAVLLCVGGLFIFYQGRNRPMEQ